MSAPRLFMALALAGTVFNAAAEDEASRSMQQTPLIFSVTGADLGIFPVIIDETSSSAVSYDLDTGVVRFTVGIAGGERYTDPLFCFNLSNDPAPVVSIQTMDANGHVVVSDIGVDSALNYLLSDAEIRIKPRANAQCFYRGAATGKFGLYGYEPTLLEQPPAEHVFGDRFEALERVSIEFANVPAFMNPGEALNYQVIVSNEGQTHLFDVALQELYPRNSELYLSTLTEGDWSCTDGGTGLCPTTSRDLLNPSSLRFQELNLPVGATMTFNVTRNVHPGALTSTTIDLFAGVVAGTGSRAPFDVDQRAITIIGEGESLVALDASARAGETALIEVSALDANMLPVPLVQIDVANDGGLTMGSMSEVTSVATGTAEFEASATVAGTYTVQFSAEDMGTAQSLVTINAADPANMAAGASSAPVIADGDDTVSFHVFVQDQYQNPVAATLVSVTDNGGLTDITSADPFTNINGIASFSGRSTVSGDFTVEFSAGDGVSDSATASFSAGAPAAVMFEQQPTDTAEGSAINPPVVVRILDANGNWADTDNQSNIQLWLLQNGSVVDSAFGFGVAENGEVIFDNLTLDEGFAGSGYSLLALAVYPENPTSSVSSETFEVTAP